MWDVKDFRSLVDVESQIAFYLNYVGCKEFADPMTNCLSQFVLSELCGM